MRQATLKGLMAHKLRLALTALAIVLGVTFVSGTLVLTDTLRQTFTSLFGHVYQNVDFVIQGKSQLRGQSDGAGGKLVPESVATKVKAIPGVADAVGGVGGSAELVAPDGKAIRNGGAPTLGFSFDPNPKLAALKLVSGRPPTGPDDVVVDLGTAKKAGLHVGSDVKIILNGPPKRFLITGLIRFGTADNLAGATIAAFQTQEAQKLFGMVGSYNAIDVLVAHGADKATVKADIAKVLPPGIEVVSGQARANQQTNQINSALGFFSTALLVFAFISLFVGGFTIFNTFSIIVGQRTRELALLRILGASRRQIFVSVLAEAGIVGLVSSLIGLGLGVLTAVGLEALLKGFGITLPAGSLVFEGHTVVAALVVGIGVTMISAISPARRAVRISPMAALADFRGGSAESSRRRLTVGAIVAVLGIAVLAVGLSGGGIQLVGLGAVAIFIGAGMLAPVAARPLSSVLGRPLAAMLGIAGRLGRENSMRSPRRTAQTASALMVGLALVSTMAVFGASLSKSATAAVDNAVRADYIITGNNQGPGGFSRGVASAAAKVPGVSAVTSVYSGDFQFRDTTTGLTGLSAAGFSDNVILQMSSGAGASALAAGELLVDTTTASSDHLQVGSVVRVKFALTGATTIRIGGIYKSNSLVGSYAVGGSFFVAHFSQPQPVAVLVHSSNGVTAAGKASLLRGLRTYPGLQVQTRAEFLKTQQQQVNQLLGLVYALLGLAILIALIGIVNTLLLSVFERTREIGLLRAVGMKRRQVRVMIRAESVILSVFGAIVGIVIGTALGVAFSWSLRGSGINEIAVPVGSMIVFLVISALLGLGAASWPARRAAKLDVLAAISTE